MEGKEGRGTDRPCTLVCLQALSAHLCCGSKAAECLGDLRSGQGAKLQTGGKQWLQEILFLRLRILQIRKESKCFRWFAKKGASRVVPPPFFFNLTFHVSLHIAMQLGPQAKMWKILAYLGLFFFLLILITLRLEATGLWINLLEVQKPQKAEACFSTKASVWVKVL